MAWWFLQTEWAEDGLRLASAGLQAMVFAVFVFWLNKKRPGPAARTVFVAFLFLIFGLTDSPAETAAGRSLIFQIVPIILAGFTITPAMSFVFAGASIALLTFRSTGIGIGINSTAYLAMLLVAFISWLVASRLEHAIEQVERMNIVLENRVAERTKQLQDANRFKSKFLAQISHELQSPIIAFTLFLRKIQPMTELQEAGALEEEALRLLEMTKSISNVSKIELEILEQRLRLEDLDLVEILDKQMFVHQFEAEESGIDLAFDQSASECRVIGDRNYLTRVFDNLIRNAIKYSPPGTGVVLSIWPEGDCVSVRVADAGIGIPAGELPTIFDRFSRASNVGGRPGSGLGLSMVKNMVEAMEGEISVESVEGEGSTFTVRLPAA
jgi:signal transduction histidine kinase